jgi:hypothetical protein
MYVLWKQDDDEIHVKPSNQAFHKVYQQLTSVSKTSDAKLVSTMEENKALIAMYLEEDDDGTVSLQFIHSVFKYQGDYYGIKGTDASPHIVSVSPALFGPVKTAAIQAPPLDELLQGEHPDHPLEQVAVR